MEASSGLPAQTRLGGVRLQVAELDRSVAFYRDLIGFAEIERGDGVVRLGTGAGSDRPAASSPSGEEAVLLELVEEPGARPVPRTGLLGLYHFALLLPTRPDLGRFLRYHTGRGTRFGAADHAFSEALYLEDPDGLTIEVYADRPRREWPGAGEPEAAGARPGGQTEPSRATGSRGLPLVSDPLDAAGLMAAAGEEEWAGVPPGAVVGHMHFFVDDLDAADRFYVSGLGFEPMITVPTAHFVSAGGYHHHVGLNTWRAGAPTATDEHARLLSWELILPDPGAVETAAGRLGEAGFDVEGVDARTRARDPWGNEVRLTA